MKRMVAFLLLILSGCAGFRHPDSVTIAQNIDRYGKGDGNWIAVGWQWK